MTTPAGWRAASCGVVAACLLGASPAGQDTGDFKTLYAQADYEQALRVLTPIATSEADQYRVLCLLALGRSDDAAGAVTRLVSDFPTFRPTLDEVPPRFAEMVASARRSLLPSIAMRAFNEGREHFGERRYAEAIARFTLVATLAADEDFGDHATGQDLTTLAQGFIDLAKAGVSAAQKAAPPAPPPDALPPTPAPEAQAPSASSERRVPPTVSQAIVQARPIPPVPRDLVSLIGGELRLLVQIDATGRVTSATVQQSAHPRYDRMVVQATREWRYQPATVNGLPTASEQVVSIQPER